MTEPQSPYLIQIDSHTGRDVTPRTAVVNPVLTLATEVLDGIEQEWIDQRISDNLEENGRIWITEEERIKADVAKRMATFRAYVTSKLAAVGRGE